MALTNDFSNLPGLSYEYNPDKPDNWGLLLAQLLPTIQKELGFASGLEDTRQATITNLIKRAGDRQGAINSFRRTATTNAKEMGRRVGQHLRTSGAGDAMAGGAELDAQNRAADATNDFSANAYSPQGENDMFGAIMNAVNAGQKPAMLDTANSLYTNSLNGQQFRRSGEQWQSQQDAQGGIGGILGSIAGLATGGGAGGFDLGSIFGTKKKKVNDLGPHNVNER
jgi:hypothetical protein